MAAKKSPNKTKKSPRKTKKARPLEKGEQRVETLKFRLKSSRSIPHLSLPPTFVKPKRIHPRHVLPLIKEGVERGFHSQSEAAFILPLDVVSPAASFAKLGAGSLPAAFPALAPLAATDQLTIVTDTELK